MDLPPGKSGNRPRHPDRPAHPPTGPNASATPEPPERPRSTASDTDLRAMLEQNLLAGRIVIASYQEIAGRLGDRDPTTRRLIESILEEEEEHADDLPDLLGS